ncbi:fumarylacetoacetate hydrolase family protein [uncultured Paludibaculum sp.]|uniref:fumarylacetoacetate hydrolase family protein n=1 Tax=uncultured Paludibaculum sp. TaxID=1765020 RepID=UPI002AABC3F2|nr:fumarylacetoacetate hydrolase family protein [uncultured Paludibaculum sp.]
MRLVTYMSPGEVARAGVVVGEQVFSLQPLGFGDVLSVIAGGAAARTAIDRYLASLPANSGKPLNNVVLLAPVPRPPKFICVGLNYRDHAAESKMEIPSVPTIFSKFSNCVTGPGAPIILPANSTKPDYEAEFAFVIGVGGRHIPADRWRDHVYGYMCVNDVSARDFQMATSQWLMGKTFDSFAPTGPWLTTADEIEDPHNLDIRMEINGETLQSSNTSNLIFNIPQLIEYLSSVFTLEPGDVVTTGTPAGVGFGHKPPRWLKAGDETVVTVQGLGSLRNPVVAEG